MHMCTGLSLAIQRCSGLLSILHGHVRSNTLAPASCVEIRKHLTFIQICRSKTSSIAREGIALV